MKKDAIGTHQSFRKVGQKHSGLRLVKKFFRDHDLVAAKNTLSQITSSAMDRNTRIHPKPSVVLDFYLSVKSLIRGCYLLQFRHKKWRLSEPEEVASCLALGSLSPGEYKDPFLVFKSAFREYDITDFDRFIAEVAYFSLGVYDGQPGGNVVAPFIYLNKMLDAAWLVVERVEGDEGLRAVE
ncbi:hypothetical protein [uncultured Chryseobacterium sp.]|uniref:hypothetical protein n=1 Tax=uncultured Chryseobacterium sp. TaxID=259322 RepID=UPI0025E72EFB|nr:hypothetical protein [uncultured Chryseobacterium sp.]